MGVGVSVPYVVEFKCEKRKFAKRVQSTSARKHQKSDFNIGYLTPGERQSTRWKFIEAYTWSPEPSASITATVQAQR